MALDTFECELYALSGITRKVTLALFQDHLEIVSSRSKGGYNWYNLTDVYAHDEKSATLEMLFQTGAHVKVCLPTMDERARLYFAIHKIIKALSHIDEISSIAVSKGIGMMQEMDKYLKSLSEEEQAQLISHLQEWVNKKVVG